MWLVAFVCLLGALAECLQALKHNSQCCLLCTSLAWSDRMHSDCVLFSCCSPTSSASAAVPWLYPLQLAAPWLCPLQLLLPDCVHFGCCSLIVSASAAVPWLYPLQLAAPWLYPLQLVALRVRLLVITHTQHIVPGIISTKIVHHYCSHSLKLPASVTYGHTQAFKILMYWCMHAYMGVCKMQRCCSSLFAFLIERVSE